MQIGTTGETLDTIHEAREAILGALGLLDALHNDERLKLPKRHALGVKDAIEALDALPDSLAELADQIETLVAA